MRKLLYVKTLQRAVEITGGEQELALRLKVTPRNLALWLKGAETAPARVFLRAVDLVTDHAVSQLGKPGDARAAKERSPGERSS